MKRFYKVAAAAAMEDGWAVQLDGRPIKTPAGKPLRVPSRLLAEAMAAEWHAQGDDVLPASMPMTQLASTALDRVAGERAAITDQLVGYSGTDLLCYRADEPAELVARQASLWQPLLDWLEARHGVALAVTSGVIPVAQSDEAGDRVRAVLDGLDIWSLCAAQAVTAACGSVVLGLAAVDGRLTAEEAFAASQVDETYQAELWGEDYEAQDRRERLRADVLAALRFLALSRDADQR